MTMTMTLMLVQNGIVDGMIVARLKMKIPIEELYVLEH